MKAFLLLFCCVPLLAVAEPLPSWPVLTLASGTEYKDVKVTAVEAGGLKIVHAGGVARVPEAQLPAQIRAMWTWDAAAAAAQEQERVAKDQAARASAAEARQILQAKDADYAAREKLKYRFMSFSVSKAAHGGWIAYRHEKSGLAGEAALGVRSIADRKYRSSEQSAYVSGGTDYSRTVFVEGGGDFAEDEIIGGFVAEHGTVEIDGRTVRRWVLKPNASLRRN